MSTNERLGSLPFTPRDEEVSGVFYIGNAPYIGTATVTFPWCDECHDIKPSMAHLYPGKATHCTCDTGCTIAETTTEPSSDEVLLGRYYKLHAAVDELVDYAIGVGVKDAGLRRHIRAVADALPDQVAQ